MNDIIKFLKELSAYNNREWFNENKAAYKKSLDEFTRQVHDIIQGISSFDIELAGLQAKDSVFRIYKDIRFSSDKTPYKTHFGAYMAKGGRKSPRGGYYFHLEPGGSFIAAGVHHPDSDRLKAIRQEIMFNPGEYMKIVRNNLAQGYEKYVSEDTLKKAPKGFPEDFEFIDELKLKHFILSKNYEDGKLHQGDITTQIILDFKGLHPYVTYLNKALDFMGND